MKIVLYEMKKIWNIKLLLIITIFCALFFYLFMEFEIKHFPNGHPAIELVDYSIQMTKEYGTTLESEEYNEFIINANAEISSQMEKYIKSNIIFSEAGIDTFADFKKVYYKSELTLLEEDAIDILTSEEFDFILFKWEALKFIEESYCTDISGYISEFYNEKEQLRLTEIQYEEKLNNILSSDVYSSTARYSECLAKLSILAVLLMIAPLIITDRTQNLNLLQYTSKRGRKIFNHQFVAVILSAILLTTALILVFGTIFSVNGTQQFLNNGLISFLHGSIFWFDITYGQSIVLFIIFTYLLCLGTATIVFIFSRYSSNIIALILKLIPTYVVVWALCAAVFGSTFSSGNDLYRITKIFGIEPIICSLIFVLGFVASLYILHRERKIDILSKI